MSRTGRGEKTQAVKNLRGGLLTRNAGRQKFVGASRSARGEAGALYGLEGFDECLLVNSDDGTRSLGQGHGRKLKGRMAQPSQLLVKTEGIPRRVLVNEAGLYLKSNMPSLTLPETGIYVPHS